MRVPAGQVATPQNVPLPVEGTVQDYPFDTYTLDARIRVLGTAGQEAPVLPATATLYFRIPGCTATVDGASDPAAKDLAVTAVVNRDFSTKAIALLMLVLMVALGAIAVLVSRSATRGRMRLELPVASWMTALLFALTPLRAFFPGAPPLGSWIDVLIFFWVVVTIMRSVALIAASLLLRAADEAHHEGPARRGGS